jgi:hypothetical protein
MFETTNQSIYGGYIVRWVYIHQLIPISIGGTTLDLAC